MARPGPDDEQNPSFTQLTNHGNLRKVNINGKVFYQVYDGESDDWTTLPNDPLGRIPNSENALEYAAFVKDKPMITIHARDILFPSSNVSIYDTLLTLSKETERLPEKKGKIHGIHSRLNPLVKRVLTLPPLIPILPDDAPIEYKRFIHGFERMFHPPETTSDSIHIVIVAHGEELQPIPFDKRVRMFFETSIQTYAFADVSLADYISDLYRLQTPVSTIIKLWSERCNTLFKQSFSKKETYLKHIQSIDPYNKDILQASNQIGTKQCYESSLLRNRLYTFNKGYDKATPLYHNNSDFSGSIRIVKCTIKGKVLPFDTLGDLLSEQPFIHPLLEHIRRIVRYLVHTRTIKQSGWLHISELILLLNRFYRIYIYDLSCRNTNESVQPSVVYQKEKHALSLLRTPSYESKEYESKDASSAGIKRRKSKKVK